MKLPSLLCTVVIGTASLAFSSPSIARGDDLFAPISLSAKAQAGDQALAAIRNNPSTRAYSLVQADAALVNESTQRLHLRLSAERDIHATQLSSYRTASGMTVWTGMVEETSAKLRGQSEFLGKSETLDDPLNMVVLVRNGDKLTGNVRIGEELFQIRPLKNGGHALVAKNSAAMPKDHPESFDRAQITQMPSSDQADAVATLANTVIRVMVNYTPSAAAASGDINGLINLAVAETNQGYLNSGVGITMELANASQISYTETGNFDTDLARYRNTSDGFMDSIHATRDSSAADVAVLVVTNNAYCGLASGIGSTAPTAFAEVYWDCATGYYSFGHEVGHLQSARHDPKNDPTNTPYSWGHGYQYIGKGRNATKWRTVMAYDCQGGCPRLLYWSNPGVTYGGIPMGTTSSSDNHRVLNTTASTVAGFR
jgi:hypothetical protein